MLFGLGRGLEKIIDIIGEILAIVALTFIVLMYINGKYSFMDAETTKNLAYFREFAIVAVISLKATEFALKRNLIIAIICFAIIAAAFILMFIPEAIPTWAATL